MTILPASPAPAPPKGYREALFWASATRDPETGCLVWSKAVSRDGYGKVTFNSQRFRAHRLAYELSHGPIPNGLLVRHTCDNPRCINPQHLQVGTVRDNAADMMSRGRGVKRAGSLNTRAILDEEQVRGIFADARPYAEIAEDCGVSICAVSNIKCGRSWRHLGLGLNRRKR